MIKMRVNFVLSDGMVDILKAVNPFPFGADAEQCSFQVGDYIANESAPGQFLRVAKRIYYPAQKNKPHEWTLVLEQAPDPLEDV